MMKLRRIRELVLIGLALALGTTTTLNQPGYAQNTTFFCGTSQGVPATIARTSRGNVPMIRWVSTNYFPPPWAPQRRCTEVSRRFQRNYDNGTLKTLKTGRLRGQPVVCAASSPEDYCTDKTLLFTLKRGSNAELTVLRLLDRRGLTSGSVLNESGCTDYCPINVDVAEYLDNAPIEQNSESVSQPNESTVESNDTPWWYQN